MRKASFLAAFMFMSAVTFAQTYKLSVTKNNGNTVVIPTEEISKIEFIEDASGVVPSLEYELTQATVPYIGGKVTLNIKANCAWTYEIDRSDVAEVSVARNMLVLKFPCYDGKNDTYNITFTFGEQTKTLALKQDTKPVADLLDIEFKADGTAVDVSPMKHQVITNPSSALTTYYSDIHKRYTANFRHTPGSSVTSGYYRINYKAGDKFINSIADGCTIETIVMLGEADPSNAEVKWFSSMQAGGIGFLMPAHYKSQCMTFLPNVSTNGASNWRWTHSQVKPEVGKYYHVVGVWNKEEGKAYIYVNGRLSGTEDAKGNFVPVTAGAESFVIGGDAENNQTVAASAWNGEVVTARIYDDPLNATQVAKLWEASAFDENTKAITISNLQCLANCEVGAGFKYTVYGEGFEAGDKIELQPVNSTTNAINPETEIGEDYARITIPAGMTSGSYRLMLKRGESVLPLSTVNFTYSATPVAPVIPKIIAHRGAHTDGATENSIAAVTKAMDENYYGIELDTWITLDGTVVVHHDGVVSGRHFDKSNYNDIKNITLANGEKLPTFDSVISTFMAKKDKSTSKLIIEIKTHGDIVRLYACIDKIMKMVADNGIKDRVEYIAFSYPACQRIVANDPEAMVGYLNGDKAPAIVLKDGIRSIDYSTGAFGNHPEWISEGRKLGMIVNVWTVNSVSQMLDFMGRGVNYITTDSPATLRLLTNKTFVSAE